MATVAHQSEIETCIQDCLACHRICLETAVCYLKQPGNTELEHMRVLLACAELCQTTVDLMLLNIDAHIHACKACAEVCEQCSQWCEQKADNAQMKLCAEACDRCVESCYYMAGIGGLDIPTTRTPVTASTAEPALHHDKVDRASDLSFPASDPPNY